MTETENFYRKVYPGVNKLTAMDIEIISILDKFKKNQDDIIKENEIYKKEIKSMIKEENYLIDLSNELINLSDSKKDIRDILKARRDIEINNRIIRSLEDINNRVVYIRKN